MGPTFNNLTSTDILSPFIQRGVEERSKLAAGSRDFREGLVGLGGAIGDTLKYHERKKIADKYTYIGDAELRALETELAGLERRLALINRQLENLSKTIPAPVIINKQLEALPKNLPAPDPLEEPFDTDILDPTKNNQFDLLNYGEAYV